MARTAANASAAAEQVSQGHPPLQQCGGLRGRAVRGRAPLREPSCQKCMRLTQPPRPRHRSADATSIPRFHVTHLHSRTDAHALTGEREPLAGCRRPRQEALWEELTVRPHSLTTVAPLFQGSFERRRPSFTRSPRRNARWRTARRPTAWPVVQVRVAGEHI